MWPSESIDVDKRMPYRAGTSNSTASRFPLHATRSSVLTSRHGSIYLSSPFLVESGSWRADMFDLIPHGYLGMFLVVVTSRGAPMVT